VDCRSRRPLGLEKELEQEGDIVQATAGNTEITSGLLRATIARSEAVSSVALSGELDLANVAVLNHILAELGEDAETVVVDLAALEFIDSSGIAALINAQRRLCDGNGGAGRLRVVPSRAEAVRRVFAITGLEGRFPNP
jgi:anti-sigma B factor antagonist